MDATEIAPKEPLLARCSLARFLPHSSTHSLRGRSSFIVQIRPFYTFRERERDRADPQDQRGGEGERASEQPILIATERSGAPSAAAAVSSIAATATKSVAADLSSSFLTDQTAVVVWFFIARCRAAFFG